MRGLRHRLLSARDEGFTLVELIVAMMIMTIVLVSLIGVQLSAVASVSEARKLQQATGLANEAMEQLRAIPWTVLSQGMHANYLTASGGDPLVTGGVLNVDGRSANVLVAGAGQQTGNWAPLFDATGSHVQTRQDPSRPGITYTVKSYLLMQGLGGETGTLGAAVVVEWDGPRNEVRRTAMWSTIYPSGCGDNDTNPFASSCQAYLDASSSSGRIPVSVSASEDKENPAPLPLMHPGAGTHYTLDMRTLDAVATVRSQQADILDSRVYFGGSTRRTNDPDAAGDDQGYATHEIRASNDLTAQDRWPQHQNPIAISQPVSAESATTITGSGSPIQLHTRSDYGRTATLRASLQQSCMTGIAAGEACALTDVAHNGSGGGIAYTEMVLDGVTIDLMRRGVSGGANSDRAWAGKFSEIGGSAAVGCQTLLGAGCAAGGAERQTAPVVVGAIGSGSWDGDAPNGIAILEGRAACGSSNYRDTVRVEMGPGQLITDPVATRCGQVRLWSGTSYSTIPLDATTSSITTSAPVTWSSGVFELTATTTVTVTPRFFEYPSAECPDATCTKSATGGTVLLSTEYILDWAGDTHRIIAAVEVVGPQARASYSLTGGEL